MDKKISQISDIHFGEKNFSDTLKDNLIRQLEDENPDLIVVSGDLTQRAMPMNMNLQLPLQMR